MRQYPPPVLDPDCDDLEAARVIGFWATGLIDQLDAYLDDPERTPDEVRAGIAELLRVVGLAAIVCRQLRTDQEAGLRDFLVERLARWAGRRRPWRSARHATERPRPPISNSRWDTRSVHKT